MLSTSLLTAVPSGLLSLWLTRGNYAKVGVEAVFSFGSVLQLRLYTLCHGLSQQLIVHVVEETHMLYLSLDNS